MRIFTNLHNADTVRVDNGWTGIIMSWNGESVDSLSYSIAKGINYIARYKDVSRWAIIRSCDAAITVTFERLVTDEVRMSVQAYAADQDRAANGKKARNTAIVLDDVSDFDAVKNALKRAMSRDRLCMQAIYGNKWSAFNDEQFMYPFRRMCEEEVCEYWNLADIDTSKVDPERLANGKKDIEWYAVDAMTALVKDGTVRAKGNAGKNDVYEVTKQCENVTQAAGCVVKCLRYLIHGYEGDDFTLSVSVPGYGVVVSEVCGGMLSIYPAHAEQDSERFGDMSRNQRIEFSLDYFIAVDVMTQYSVMELSLLRDSRCAKAIGASVAVESEPTTVESSAAVVPVETVIVEPVEVEHDDVVDVELAETSETIPVVESEREPADVEPRTVESSPQLPTECSAETQEIPEVPPQTNEDARVLQVSEHVIPACVTLKEYELTRNVPRKHCKQFRDSRGRKCAYVVRADTGAFILWRSWYQHDDAELDAAVRAYYAQVA